MLDATLDTLGFSENEAEQIKEYMTNPIYNWYIQECMREAAHVPMDSSGVGRLRCLMGTHDPKYLTLLDLELMDRTGKAFGGVYYPTDSVESGNYWHFKTPPLGWSHTCHRRDINPISPQHPIFVDVLSRIHSVVIESVTHTEKGRPLILASAQATPDSEWHKGPIGRAVTQAFLDTV